MTPEEARKLFNVTPEQLDTKAKPYEDGTYEHSDEPVIVGSHLDHVGKKRITVIYDAKDTQEVNRIAKKEGVNPSNIYRTALKSFLMQQGIA